MADKKEKNKMVPYRGGNGIANLKITDLFDNVSIEIGDRLLITYDHGQAIATVTHYTDDQIISTDIGSWDEKEFVRKMDGKEIKNIQLIVEDEDE